MIHFGAAYYPEHWPRSRWTEDIHLMEEAGITVIRMGEFAWSTMEPTPGQFAFGWLDDAINLLSASGIKTVLGTPTAAPPAWLVEKYPNILPVKDDSHRMQFGSRCHYCVNAPEVHTAAVRIVEAMAAHFGSNPNVIGWQVDNEFNRVCYCDRCQKKFQMFLKERYGEIEVLNQAWATAYWSQTYNHWEQIPIPMEPGIFPGVFHNPGLLLEFKRFNTASFRAFQKMQVDVLRKHIPTETWVTHNCMGWFGGFDYYEINQDLDLASWDWYIGTGHHDYYKTGAIHDLTRGFKGRNFWVMETQPGHVNWLRANTSLNQGEARAMAWHAIGHGADALLYWQWRSAPGGQEQYHGTLVDQSGQPRPFYDEASQIGSELRSISSLFEGSVVKAQIAMLNCYESRWSIEWQRHQADFDYVEHFNHYYRPLIRRNFAVDILSADSALDGYRLVIAPALLILDPERVARLEAFVARGGTLVLTIRSGMKDRHNALLPSRQPGGLARLSGVEVEDYYALAEPVPVKGYMFSGSTSKQWAERLRVINEAVLVAARFGPSNGWLDDQPAITFNSYGEGTVYTFGAYLDDTSQQRYFDHILETVIKRPQQIPDGVEICTRVRPSGEELYIIINHERSEKLIKLPWDIYEHLNGLHAGREIILPPYGVAVASKDN